MTEFTNPIYMEIEVAINAIAHAIQISQNSIVGTSYDFDSLRDQDDEVYLLELARVGMELLQKEDDAEFAALKHGEEYHRSCSATPPWLE